MPSLLVVSFLVFGWGSVCAVGLRPFKCCTFLLVQKGGCSVRDGLGGGFP